MLAHSREPPGRGLFADHAHNSGHGAVVLTQFSRFDCGVEAACGGELTATRSCCMHFGMTFRSFSFACWLVVGLVAASCGTEGGSGPENAVTDATAGVGGTMGQGPGAPSEASGNGAGGQTAASGAGGQTAASGAGGQTAASGAGATAQSRDAGSNPVAPDVDDIGEGGAAAAGGSAAQGQDGCLARAGASTAALGYGRAATGGGDQTPIVVNSFDEAAAALAAYRDAFKAGDRGALVIRYAGIFDFTTISDVCAQHEKAANQLQIKEMENVTFEGAPGSSANFGIKISRAKNIIVRNMTLGLLPGGGSADAITLEGNDTNGDVEHVLIDHNELFSSTKDDCPGAGDTEFDGLIDIKRGARYITVSYNYLHDHQKTGLLGSSDTENTERYVTFHHNRYENVASRTPLVRFGYIHVFNNYFGHIKSSGINVRMGAVALIESNYFEHATNPITSRYSAEAGYWDLRDNFVGEGISWTVSADTLANADDWKSTAAFPEDELGYEYTPEPAECVKASVLSAAGATLP